MIASQRNHLGVNHTAIELSSASWHMLNINNESQRDLGNHLLKKTEKKHDQIGNQDRSNCQALIVMTGRRMQHLIVPHPTSITQPIAQFPPALYFRPYKKSGGSPPEGFYTFNTSAFAPLLG